MFSAKRETTPQTIYKKQKLDRDDIIDITDFDVVAFINKEMRFMIIEEMDFFLDGRQRDSKIKESNHLRRFTKYIHAKWNGYQRNDKVVHQPIELN